MTIRKTNDCLLEDREIKGKKIIMDKKGMII